MSAAGVSRAMAAQSPPLSMSPPLSDVRQVGVGSPIAPLPAAQTHAPDLPDHELATLPEFLQQAMRGDRYISPHPAIGGNTTKLLVDYPAFEAELLRDLESAKRVINASMFIWRDDGLGRKVNEVLKRKAAEGVEVNVIVDGVGGSQTGPFPRGITPWFMTGDLRAMMKDLADAGVNVRANWRYGGSEMSSEANRGFDHRKAIQVDGRTSYVGGMNLAEAYGKWHDTMLRIEGPASARVGAHLIGRWRDVGGEVSARNIDASRRAALGPSAGNATVEVHANNASTGPRRLADNFFDQVAGAKQRVWVLSPSIGSPDHVRALAEASRRGVDVRVIVASLEQRDDNKPNWLLTSSFFKDLVDAGVDLRERHDVVPHAKVWLVDDDVTLSSYNLSNRSQQKDYELGALVTTDPALLADTEALFAADHASSEPVTQEQVGAFGNRAVRFLRERFGLKY